MTPIYKTAEGERLVRERYLAFLKCWPVANEHVRIATSQGETFVVTCGDANAPPLSLLHGSAGNSVMWLGDIPAFAARFHEHFRPRMAKLPIFRDESLSRITMPVLAIVGARDVMLDSAATKRRLERTVPEAEVTMLLTRAMSSPDIANASGRVLE